MRKFLYELLSLAVAAVLFLGLAYLFTPTLIWSVGGLFLAAISLLIVGSIFMGISGDNDDMKAANKWMTIGGGAVMVITVILVIIGSAMFNAKTYKNSVTINYKTAEEAAEVLPTIDDIDRIALMDSKSARKLGDRTLGTLANYVSQYEVARGYSTISYQGRIVKVAPLEYGGFWKAMKNKTIPGYVIVDVAAGEAKFVEVEGGMKYSMSGYFNRNAYRHVWLDKPSVLMDGSGAASTTGGYQNISFQLDEDGIPYYVFTTLEYDTLLNCLVPNGVAILNTVTGDIERYAISDIPQWIELTYSGDEVEELYDRYGRYINGFINFSKTGETKVTDDYGYLEKDGDIYIYTGVTSVGGDESNIGFLLVNSRTGEFDFYPIPGAEEYSAMSAAEGLVQNYGYTAAFPSLVMVDNIPTYVLCLRDSNLLVKQYAMVNVTNYSIVAVGDSIENAKAKYIKALGSAGSGQSVIGSETYEKATITIAEIIYLNVGDEAMVYWKDTDGNVYRQTFNEQLLFVNEGDTVTVEFSEVAGIRVIK